MICRHCKNEVPDTSEYCPYCGMELATQESEESGRSFFGGKRRIKRSPSSENVPVSDNNNSQRGQYGLNNRIGSRIALVGAMVLLLLIAVILPIEIGTNNNAVVSSDTGKSLTPSALLGDTSSSSATTGSTAAVSEAEESAQEAADAAGSKAEEPAQEASDANATDSLPASADADSNEKEEGAPVITCDVNDLVLQVGESHEVLITAGGSNLPDRLAISVTSIQGIIDWEWEEWVDNRSVKGIVTGMIEGDVQLEIYFSDANDESEEPFKYASTYLNVKVIPNENSASSDQPDEGTSKH